MATLSKYVDADQIPSLMGGTQADTCWAYPYPEESGCSPAQIAEFVAYRDGMVAVNNQRATNETQSKSEETQV
jgi:hypothetical protein